MRKNELPEKFVFKMLYIDMIKNKGSILFEMETEATDLYEWIQSVKNIVKHKVRTKYLTTGFNSSGEMYLYATAIVKTFYDKPFQLILVELN